MGIPLKTTASAIMLNNTSREDGFRLDVADLSSRPGNTMLIGHLLFSVGLLASADASIGKANFLGCSVDLAHKDN